MDIWKDRYLLSELGENYKHYNFHTFVFKGEKFVFITKMSINFLSFLNGRTEKEAGFLVEGALYDAKRHKFVDAPCKTDSYKKKHFYEYYIYDASVPNIVFDREKNGYIIITMKDEKITFTETCEIITTVTQLFVNESEEGFRRAIFYEKKKYGKKTKMLLIIDDGLCYYDEAKNVEYNNIVVGKNTTKEEQAFLDALLNNSHIRESFCITEETRDAVNLVYLTHYFITGDTCIIVKSNESYLGELTPVLIGKKILLDFNYSGFSYEVLDSIKDEKLKNHLIIKWLWRRNDFENGTSYFDATEMKVYDHVS